MFFSRCDICQKLVLFRRRHQICAMEVRSWEDRGFPFDPHERAEVRVLFCHVCGQRAQEPIVPRWEPEDEHDYMGPGVYPPSDPSFYYSCETCGGLVLRPNLGGHGPFLMCSGCERLTYLGSFCVHCGNQVRGSSSQEPGTE